MLPSVMLFFFQCKTIRYKIEYFQSIFNSIQLEKCTEDDIVAAMGTEAFRDQCDGYLILGYMISDGLKNMLMLFELKKNTGGVCVLYNKKFIEYQSKTSQKEMFTKKFKELNQKKPYQIIEITSKDEMQAEIHTEENNNLTQNQEVITDKEIFIKYSFSEICFSNYDIESIQKALKIKNQKFNFSSYFTVDEKIKLLTILKILIGNSQQESVLTKQLLNKFIDRYNLKKENLDELKITDLDIMAHYGYIHFFLSQQDNLNQFNVLPMSKFKKYEQNVDLSNKNSVFIISYEIKHNNQIKIYEDISHHNIPAVFIPYIQRGGPLNQYIEYEKNYYVKFIKIKKVFNIDQITEIKIITIPKSETCNLTTVKDICYSFLNNKKIENELRRFFKGVESQNRKIAHSSATGENIDILNALESYGGKFVIEQEDNIIVVLSINTMEKNAKLSKKNITENSESCEDMIRLILAKLCCCIKY